MSVVVSWWMALILIVCFVDSSRNQLHICHQTSPLDMELVIKKLEVPTFRGYSQTVPIKYNQTLCFNGSFVTTVRSPEYEKGLTKQNHYLGVNKSFETEIYHDKISISFDEERDNIISETFDNGVRNTLVKINLPHVRYLSTGVRRYVLELLELRNEYPVLSSHVFASAVVTTSCYCDIPTEIIQQSFKCEEKKDDLFCYRKDFVNLSELEGRGDKNNNVSCELKINPQHTYTSLLVGFPVTIVKLAIQVDDSDGLEVIPRTVLERSITNGIISIGYIRIEILETNLNVSSIQPGIYFLNEEGEIYLPGRDLVINLLKEDDTSNLGWLKNLNGKWNIPDREDITSNFELELINCRENRFNTKIHVDKWYGGMRPEKKSEHMKNLRFYPTKFGNGKLLELFDKNVKLDVRVYDEVSWPKSVNATSLQNFIILNSSMRVTTSGNVFGIVLIGAVGLILAEVNHRDYGSEFLTFNTGVSSQINQSFEKIITFCSNDTNICLWPVSSETVICKKFNCTELPISFPKLQMTRIKHSISTGQIFFQLFFLVILLLIEVVIFVLMFKDYKFMFGSRSFSFGEYALVNNIDEQWTSYKNRLQTVLQNHLSF
ncbi:uncharacterized protein LOC143255552 [Tachypleus tridentatus]|uniref:uncharacterized protein LOC143255552 n=1 Tax=Tachypleus tridentatus TaxID=6853 RepID=UPI003FD18641